MNRNIEDMREHYTKGFLVEDNIAAEPIEQFKVWFAEATDSGISEPNAMILATADGDGIPSARTVLLKEIDSEGFIFYTNYNSHKATDILRNPNVSLVFLWKDIERQVRVSGRAEKIPSERSDAYYQKRPLGSRLGAWISPQSDIIKSREILDKRKEEIAKKFEDAEKIPLPDFWGGYIVKPTSVEFWQGRPSRLHDRLRYRLEDKKWTVERLAP